MNRSLTLILTCLMLALAACTGTTPTPAPDSGQTINPTAETTPIIVPTETAVPEPSATVPPTITTEPTTESNTTPDVRGTPVPAPTATTPVRGTAEPLPTLTTPVRGTPEPLPTGTMVDDSLGLAVPLSLELLKNSEYLVPSTSDAPIQLSDGVYEDGSDPDSPLVVRLLEAYIAYGDVDGDGLEDAVVPLATTTGGTGVFVDIVLVSGESGTIAQLATTPLGDRVILKTITATLGVVTVNMITGGPNDPACCPTLEVTVPYIYENGVLTAGEALETEIATTPIPEGPPQ